LRRGYTAVKLIRVRPDQIDRIIWTCKTPLKSVGATAGRHQAIPRRPIGAGGVRGASRSGSASVITTHALLARKVQPKLSNGVAGFAAGGSSLGRQRNRGNRASSQRCRSMTKLCARTPPGWHWARAAYLRRRSSNATGLRRQNSVGFPQIYAGSYFASLSEKPTPQGSFTNNGY
jgi:hypothetical protein